MYSMVLMMALSGGAEVPDCHRHGCCGCYGGGYGGCYGGCYGGGYGGCYGGCYGGGYGGCYGGCYGGMTYGGCYGGMVVPYGAAPTTTKPETVKPPKSDKEESNLGPASATLVVTLPADAKLRVDGHATTSTTAVRRFTTPPLDLGKEYFYTLTAEVPNEGKTEVITQRVTVRAGQETRATLTLPIATASAR
jgi:uncharacterized protein (TIGR03000 family)